MKYSFHCDENRFNRQARKTIKNGLDKLYKAYACITKPESDCIYKEREGARKCNARSTFSDTATKKKANELFPAPSEADGPNAFRCTETTDGGSPCPNPRETAEAVCKIT